MRGIALLVILFSNTGLLIAQNVNPYSINGSYQIESNFKQNILGDDSKIDGQEMEYHYDDILEEKTIFLFSGEYLTLDLEGENGEEQSFELNFLKENEEYYTFKAVLVFSAEKFKNYIFMLYKDWSRLELLSLDSEFSEVRVFFVNSIESTVTEAE